MSRFSTFRSRCVMGGVWAWKESEKKPQKPLQCCNNKNTVLLVCTWDKKLICNVLNNNWRFKETRFAEIFQ